MSLFNLRRTEEIGSIDDASILAGFEPAATEARGAVFQGLASVALSLKRIADALDQMQRDNAPQVVVAGAAHLTFPIQHRTGWPPP